MTTPTDRDARTEAGCRIITPVANPLLIKITTIKEKYLDQMPCREEIPDGAAPIGTTTAWVVARLPNRHLVRIHRSDWQKGLTAGTSGSHTAVQEAARQIENYPQIFES